ncbi:MAG: outer membrane beta-barrel protein [Novosphingobium sp.]|uniref:outer membrane protein n=1 Tax=Novosphingobium sp. TaxID=1874826 RepID=UPI0032BB236E
MNPQYRLITIGAALAALGSALPAQAEAPQLRVAAIAGLERTDAAPGTGAQDGFYYGVQLGADWDLGSVQVGVEGELGDSTAAALNLPGQPAQGLFGNAAVRLAVSLTGRSRVFVRGGYAYHKINSTLGPDFEGHGYVVGGGAEVDLANNLFVRGEYRFSNYGQSVRGQHFVGGVGLRF